MLEWMDIRVNEYMYINWARKISYEHRIFIGKQIGK
jgi:hypothetical protein